MAVLNAIFPIIATATGIVFVFQESMFLLNKIKMLLMRYATSCSLGSRSFEGYTVVS